MASRSAGTVPGITRDFSCLGCGAETGMPIGRRRGLTRFCGRCAVAWTAARLLDDGTGSVAAPLKALADALAASHSPTATLNWLRTPHIQDLLTHLATGQLPLTHEALDAWPRRRAVHYLRALLVDCGVLPAADPQLRQFGLWHQLPGMRARAAAGPLRATACQYARTRFTQAQTFLTWTHAAGVRPSALTQAHIDGYYASHGTHQREGVRAFLGASLCRFALPDTAVC